MNFDDWDDYSPITTTTDIKVNKPVNPNLIELDENDDISPLEMSEEEYSQIFEYYSEDVIWNENPVVRFTKETEYIIDDEKIEIFNSTKNDELFLIRKGDNKYLTHIYQPNEYYLDDTKLTFTGWDYNIIVDLKNMKYKTINVR